VSWGTTIGVALLTAIAGAAASCWLTYECVIWCRLRTPDLGELGYYLIFVPAGALCGLVLGTLVSRFVPGHWKHSGGRYVGQDNGLRMLR